MKFFDAVVMPTILFGLHTLALTGVQLSKLDSLHKRMLRSMVWWIRIQDESWHDTMSRMKSRVSKALHQHSGHEQRVWPGVSIHSPSELSSADKDAH